MKLPFPALLVLPLLISSVFSAVDYEGNLARIPASDPRVEDAPGVVSELKGVHPRLLFTPDQVAGLRKKIEDSPVLKEIANNVVADSRRFRQLPKENPLPVVVNDSNALAGANGSWPSLAYAYALAPNPETLEAISNILRRMLEQPFWSQTSEVDSSMGAACNLFAVALLYDAAYKDLDPELRRQVAGRLLVQARRMHYLGHKKLALDTLKIWQQDPANNHRWYRLRGLAAALLAIADEPALDTGYLLRELKDEMDFIMKWYPEEAACHEGSTYQQFGFRSILDSAIMMDQVLGTSYLKHPGFRHAWTQQLYYWVPGSNTSVSFGDAQNSRSVFNYDDAAFFINPALNRDPNVQAALFRRFENMAVHPDPKRPPSRPWSLLAYHDPTLEGGDYRAVPTNHLFADMGAASFRDSWEDDAVIFTFKSGPYGGYGLNDYRHTVLNKEGRPHYVNIAHDDPDANTFALNVAGENVFHPGLYSTRKITRDHSGITVGELGQIQEGSDYTQPTPDRDMRDLSFLTGWKAGDQGRTIIEGEAGPAYQGTLDRFRRTAVWLPGDYILILDDVRPAAKAGAPLVWRGTVPGGRFENPGEGKSAVVTASGREVPFQFRSDRPVSAAFDHWFLAGRWGHELAKQFQFSVEPGPARLATLIDPWKRGSTMTYDKDGDAVTLTVKTGDSTDSWIWKPAADGKTPSSLEGRRDGKPLIALTAADLSPTSE